SCSYALSLHDALPICGFGATIAAGYGWHKAFYWFGIIGMVYSLVLVLFLKETRNTIGKEIAGATQAIAQVPILKGLSQLFSTVVDRKSTRLNSSHVSI